MFIGLIHAVQHRTGEVLPQNVATGLYGERQVLFWGGGSQPKPPFPQKRAGIRTRAPRSIRQLLEVSGQFLLELNRILLIKGTAQMLFFIQGDPNFQ